LKKLCVGTELFFRHVHPPMNKENVMDFWQTYGTGFFLAAFVLVVGLILMNRAKHPVKLEMMRAEEEAREAYEAAPKCVCGDIARHPAPVLERTRGAWSWLRNIFAFPPSYRRTVDLQHPPVFCTAHAHVADAMMDQFIFKIRSEYSNLNAKLAADAAGFEQEALLRAVSESLTDTQKRTTRKSPALVRVLPVRTGTDDGEV
jgi:hypothetical protein